MTVSVSSEETPEPVSDPDSLSPGQEASATAAEPGADGSSRGPEPGGDSGARGGPEGIATSLASLILSEAIAQATGTASAEPGKAAGTAGDSPATGAEGQARPAEPPSPTAAAVPCDGLCPAAAAPACPREPCQLGGDRGQSGDTEDSAEATDVEPKVGKTPVGKFWETPGVGAGSTHRGIPGWGGTRAGRGDAGPARGTNPARGTLCAAGGAGAAPLRGVGARERPFPLWIPSPGGCNGGWGGHFRVGFNGITRCRCHPRVSPRAVPGHRSRTRARTRAGTPQMLQASPRTPPSPSAPCDPTGNAASSPNSFPRTHFPAPIPPEIKVEKVAKSQISIWD